MSNEHKPLTAAVATRCCGNCTRSAACSRNVNPNECVIFAPGPSYAAVREAFRYFDDLRGEWSDEQLEDHLETLLSYLRAVQAPRLTGEQVDALNDLMVDLGVRGMTRMMDNLAAAFPGVFGKEG